VSLLRSISRKTLSPTSNHSVSLFSLHKDVLTSGPLAFREDNHDPSIARSHILPRLCREGLWIWFEELACPNPKGLIILVHGLAEDSSRHLHVAKFACPALCPPHPPPGTAHISDLHLRAAFRRKSASSSRCDDGRADPTIGCRGAGACKQLVSTSCSLTWKDAAGAVRNNAHAYSHAPSPPLKTSPPPTFIGSRRVPLFSPLPRGLECLVLRV
jgi:hypothetical protein